ncbi:MAG TPA: hypothetical protein VGS79_26370 [Puia sp.]|nr:hypothetical protein [Puia sp.]
MNKFFILCGALLCLFISCKKSNSSSNYHVTATIGDSTLTFNTSPQAFVINLAGQTDITIEGFASSSLTRSLALGWTNDYIPNSSFGVGTYSDTSINYGIVGTYIPGGTQEYVSGSGIYLLAESSGATIANHLKIVITAVDSTHVQGTFSGDFYYGSTITGAIKTITNGDFDVPWKK